MSKEYSNYSETFCDAVDIIVSEKLKQLEYDVTKVCTIIDNVYKNLGRYTVQEENIKFEAYSANTTFNVGDAVLVVIPNGDYNMQKMILSKVAHDDDLKTSIAYSSPLSNMLKFTDNLITNNNEFSLLANDPNRTEILMYSVNWNNGINDSYSDYTRMGVSVDFQTWLSDLSIYSGTYGLLFYFYDTNSTVADIANRNSAYSFTLNVADILGNPYEFDTYFTQEKLFDISFLQNITQLDIYFYQNKDFKDYSGQLIHHEEIGEDEEFGGIISQTFGDNLFVNNLKIYLGYAINAFSGDELRLTTNDANSYSVAVENNDKTLLLKWIHKIDEEHYELLNSDSENIELYWVRYGESSQLIEHIVGTGWTQKNLIMNSLNPFQCTLNIDNVLKTQQDIRIKVIGRVQQKDGNWIQYTSNVLTFTSSDPRVDEITFNAAKSLSIECLDQSEGNYLIYNQNSELINEGLGQGYLRSFYLYYKGVKLENSELKDNIAQIQWIIPCNDENNQSYTMLNCDLSDIEEDLIKHGNNSITITYSNIENKEGYELKYSIANTWYASNAYNTIRCNLTSKTGVIYEAIKDLTFGKANSQGSNLSLVLSYTDNKNAYEVKTDSNNQILSRPQMEIQGLIYDLSGKTIPSNGSWEWALQGDEFVILDGENKVTSISKDNCTKIGIQLKDNIFTLNACYNIIAVTYIPQQGQPITAYLPLSIKTMNADEELRCASMEGARKIIYNAASVPSYYTGAYILRNKLNEEIPNIHWILNNEGNSNYPTLSEINGYKALLANPVFIKDFEYRAVITATCNEDGKEIIYWIQPILIMQSAYDFAILNEWSGKTEINAETYIASSVVAAGKKDSDNTFSGIVLGDLEEWNTDKTNSILTTGLYGLSKGILTFYLTDKGQATFLGDKTRVLLGGENNLIQRGKSGPDDTLESLEFNFDDGTLQFDADISKQGKLLLSTGNPYLQLDSDVGTILSFSTEENYLQSPDYNNANDIGLHINLRTKSISGKHDSLLSWSGAMFLNTGKTNDNTTFFQLNTDSNEPYFQIGKLSVKADGEVYYNDKPLSELLK